MICPQDRTNDAVSQSGLVELKLYVFRWLHGALVVVLVLICLRCGGLWYNFNQGAKC